MPRQCAYQRNKPAYAQYQHMGAFIRRTSGRPYTTHKRSHTTADVGLPPTWAREREGM